MTTEKFIEFIPVNLASSSLVFFIMEIFKKNKQATNTGEKSLKNQIIYAISHLRECRYTKHWYGCDSAVGTRL